MSVPKLQSAATIPNWPISTPILKPNSAGTSWSVGNLISSNTLRIRFEDETERIIDFRPVLAGEIYGPLRDPSLFNQVQIDPEVCTLVWPNGADFDPATLHDWPQYFEALVAAAQRWESGSQGERETA